MGGMDVAVGHRCVPAVPWTMHAICRIITACCACPCSWLLDAWSGMEAATWFLVRAVSSSSRIYLSWLYEARGLVIRQLPGFPLIHAVS